MITLSKSKLLGLLVLLFSDNLNSDKHVSYVLSTCLQSLYLIKLLHSQLSQGMPERKLHETLVA